MTAFTWRNCLADVYGSQHGRMVLVYQDDVVDPAVAVLRDKVAELDRSHEPWAPFARRDAEELLRESLLAFALAIQSLWERQLRNYVRDCAREQRLDAGVEEDALAGNWSRVERAFHAARGIELASFPSYPTLRALHLAANVCRHGDGPSVDRLRALRPDYWPAPAAASRDDQVRSAAPTASLMRLEADHLREFTGAIVRFWEDAEYIYLESLGAKHENVVAKLAELRLHRTWYPQARLGPR